MQLWQCGECGSEYRSPLLASEVTCSKRHRQVKMKLIEGEEVSPRQSKTTVVSKRPRATRISTAEELKKVIQNA